MNQLIDGLASPCGRTFAALLLAYLTLVAPLASVAAQSPKVKRDTPAAQGAGQPAGKGKEQQPGPGAEKVVPLPAPNAVQAAVITATKTDGVALASPVRPGATVTYTVTITNTGDADATGVSFNDTLGANLTLVPGSIQTQPIALADAYNVLGNVRIDVPAASGLLANDTDPDTGTGAASGLTITAAPTSSARGGQVSINTSTGAFTYDPPSGYDGADSFSYTVTDATGKTDTATVSLTVAGMIWFVQTGATACTSRAAGCGRLTNPFSTLQSFQAAQGGAGTNNGDTVDPEAGDNIFLYTGNASYTGPLTLLNNQKLIGQGATGTLAAIAGVTPPANSDPLPQTKAQDNTLNPPTITSAAGGILLASGNTLRGFNVGAVGAAQAKIQGTNFGTLTVGNSATPDVVLNGSGQALNLSNGTLSSAGGLDGVSSTGNTAATAAVLLSQIADSDGAGGGAFSFGSTTVSTSTSGGISLSNSTADINFGITSINGATRGVDLQSNTAGTRTFGTLTIQSITGVGFQHASNGGNVNVTGATSITNTTNECVSVSGANSTLTFAATAVDKGANAGNAVVLANVGSTTFASLSVTTSNGTALSIAHSGATTPSYTVTNGTGAISATGGAAMSISHATGSVSLNLNFASITSTNSNIEGVKLDRVSGSVTAGSTTVGGATGPALAGISAQNSSANFSFGNTSVTGSGGAGVSLASNTGTAAFGALSISPDAGQTALLVNTSGTITSASGTVSTTDAPALSVTAAPLNMTLTSVTADNTGDADSCVTLTNATGTLTVNGGALTGGTGAAFNVSGGTVNSTYKGNVSQASAARVVSVDGTTGGTVAFNTGTVTSTGSSTGVQINNANGGGVSFAGYTHGTSGARLSTQAVMIAKGTGNGNGTFGLGAVSIFTTGGSAQGIVATDIDGTLNVASGTVNTAGAAAVNINGPAGLTTLGMSLTTVAASGSTNGILVQDTDGSFTVNGTGTTDGSGGTIQNTTGRGASFISATNVTLKNMTFTNAGTTDLDATNGGLSTGDNLDTNAAVHLATVTNVRLDNVDITGGAEQGINGNTVSNFTLNNSTVANVGNAADEDNIHFFNMSGASAITNTTLTHTSGGGDDNLNLQTQSGNLDLLISGGGAVGAAGVANQQGSGYLFGIRGTTTANITFEGASSTNNSSGGIVADAFDSATMNLRVVNSTSSGNNDQLSVSAGDSSSVDLDATGNTLSSIATGDFVVLYLLGSAFDNGFTFDARIYNNTISVASGLVTDGIGVFNAGGGAMNVAITDNPITYAGTQRAILIQGGQDGAGTLRTTVTGNTFNSTLDASPDPSILAQASVTNAEYISGQPPPTTSGDNFKLDLSLGGAGALANTFSHAASIPGGDIRVRQRFQGFVNLDGYGGGAMDTAAAVNYLNGRNNEVSSSTVTVDTTGSTGGGGTVADPADTVGPGLTGNITPPFISVSVSAASVAENGGTNLVYTLTRTGSTAASLVTNFAVTGTASATSDFTVSGATTFTAATGLGTATFSAGSATTTITVDPTADSAAEFDESVVLDAGNSATANGSFARAVITNDDAAPFGPAPSREDTTDSLGSTLTGSQMDTPSVADGAMNTRVASVSVNPGLSPGEHANDVAPAAAAEMPKGAADRAQAKGRFETAQSAAQSFAHGQKPGKLAGDVGDTQGPAQKASPAGGASRPAKTGAAAPQAANFPVNIGTLRAGDAVTITFQVTVAATLSPASASSVSNQGTVSATSLANVPTNDPETAAAGDSTVTNVDKYEPGIDIATSDGDTQQGESVTFTATLTPGAAPGAPLPTGTVTFADTQGDANPANDVVLCSNVALSAGASSSTAQCATTAVAAGARTVAAVYSGDGRYDPATDTVQQTVTACQAALTVTSTADDGSAGTLRHAITNACAGSTITFDIAGAGPHAITLGGSGELLIQKNLTVAGPTGESVSVVGGSARAFRVTQGTVRISNLTVRDSDPTGASGGGLLAEGATTVVTLAGMTFSGNSALGGSGGAISVKDAGAVLHVVNTTVSGNAAGAGGGFHNDGGTLNLVNSTVTLNDANAGNAGTPGAGQGGGVYSQSGTTNVRNTILAGNLGQSTFENVIGTLTNQGNNLIGVAAGIDTTLASNGGPTQTHKLLAGSAALDSGNNCVTTAGGCAVGDPSAAVSTDQRGFTRPADAADADTADTVDIGAVEMQAAVAVFADAVIAQDTSHTVTDFSIGDSDRTLTVTVTSDNQTLVPDANAVVTAGSSADRRSLAVTPAAGQTGTANITVTVTDTASGDSMSDTFLLTVSTGLTPTVTITADAPDPSIAGQAVIVTYTVTGSAGAPTGNVTVTASGGAETCTGTVAAGQCQITLTAAGNRTLTATYSGDAAYVGGTDTEAHAVHPSVTVSNATASEPSSGSANVTFAVHLSAASTDTVTVDFATADEAPGAGKAVAGQDYTPTSGAITFNPGQTLQSISVPVLADAQAGEPDETFLLNLTGATNANISVSPADSQAVGTITESNPAGTVLISELRTSGPGGAADDYVELYNNTDADIDISGYALFQMGASCTAQPVLVATLPISSTIPARGHFLLAGSGYSLANYGGAGAAAADAPLSADLASDRSFALFSTADAALLSTQTRRDAVGFLGVGAANVNGNCDLLREGARLADTSGSASEHSLLRKLETGRPADTNDNAADFAVVSTTPATPVGDNATPRLGAPGPERTTSPVNRTATLKPALLDATQGQGAAPNRVRTGGTCPNAPGGCPAYALPNGTNNPVGGELVIRRRFTNTTAGAVTRLRVRLVDVTAGAAPTGTADLRALTSVPSVTIPGVMDPATCGAANGGDTTTPCSVEVQGTTLEAPSQLSGGGYNSTLLLPAPLAAGQSLSVQFVLGVAQGGSFRFLIVVEALP